MISNPREYPWVLSKNKLEMWIFNPREYPWIFHFFSKKAKITKKISKNQGGVSRRGGVSSGKGSDIEIDIMPVVLNAKSGIGPEIPENASNAWECNIR